MPAGQVFYFRGWVAMGLLSVFLFIIVGVPAAYIPTTRNRTIYVAVVTPVMWVVYNIVAYFFLYRPMIHCTSVFHTGECCKTRYEDGGSDVYLLTKEIFQLNNSLHALKCETTEMKATTTFINQQIDSQRNEDDTPRDRSPFMTITPGER